MEINKQKVADRIKKIRTNKGMTLEEFGKLFGASKSSVLGWETQRSLPNPERLKQIAKIGDMTVDEFLYGDDLEKIINLANEIINNNIKNNHDKEYEFFNNPENFNELIVEVFNNLSVQNALKENFNEYNVKDFINKKAKEMLQKIAFLPVTNENLINLVKKNLRDLIQNIEDYSSISEKDNIVSDYNNKEYSDFSDVILNLPKLIYTQKTIHPELSIDLVEKIEGDIERIRNELTGINPSEFESEIDKINNKFQKD